MRVDLYYESRFVFLKCKKGGRAATLPLFSVWAELVSQIMHYEPEIVQHFLADNLVVLDATISFLVKRCDLGENTSTSPDNFAVYLTKRKYFSMWKIYYHLAYSLYLFCADPVFRASWQYWFKNAILVSLMWSEAFLFINLMVHNCFILNAGCLLACKIIFW